jgi:hypothetical protein
VGVGDRSGVGAGVVSGVGSRGTHVRDGGFTGLWWASFVELAVRGVHGSVCVVGGVGIVTGDGGEGETRGSVLVVWARARESISSRTRTRLLIMRRTPLMSRLLVERADTSFRVDLKRWRKLEAMNNQ